MCCGGGWWVAATVHMQQKMSSSFKTLSGEGFAAVDKCGLPSASAEKVLGSGARSALAE